MPQQQTTDIEELIKSEAPLRDWIGFHRSDAVVGRMNTVGDDVLSRFLTGHGIKQPMVTKDYVYYGSRSAGRYPTPPWLWRFQLALCSHNTPDISAKVAGQFLQEALTRYRPKSRTASPLVRTDIVAAAAAQFAHRQQPGKLHLISSLPYFTSGRWYYVIRDLERCTEETYLLIDDLPGGICNTGLKFQLLSRVLLQPEQCVPLEEQGQQWQAT